MVKMDGIWLQNKRQNKNLALGLLLFMGAGIMGVYDSFGIEPLSYSSTVFRVVAFFILVWIGIGLFKRKLAAI